MTGLSTNGIRGQSIYRDFELMIVTAFGKYLRFHENQSVGLSNNDTIDRHMFLNVIYLGMVGGVSKLEMDDYSDGRTEAIVREVMQDEA
jgi:hypothetical protein